MFIVYEYASCVLVAGVVAGLAVTAISIYALLQSGRGIIQRNVHQLMHRAS